MTYRFFHHNLTGVEAEQRMMSVNSLVGTFLVRPSKSQPDRFVLSIVVLEKKAKILHVMITCQVDFHFRIIGVLYSVVVWFMCYVTLICRILDSPLPHTLCLKENVLTLKWYSSKLQGAILMKFGRNIQNALE